MTLLVLIVGCSEDPVTPPPSAGNYDFDSARFNWSVDTVNDWGFDLFSFYSPDTNIIFAANSVNDYFLVIQNGIQTRYYFNDFSPHFVDGLNSNEVYIGGGRFNGNIYLPHLKKWTGAGFIDIEIQTKDSIDEVIINGLVNSNNDMWFCTKQKLIRYDGMFKEYKYSDTPRVPNGFFVRDGLVPTIVSNDLNTKVDTILRNYVYELQGDTVIKTFQNTWYQSNHGYIQLGVMKNLIYGFGNNYIYDFNKPQLSPIIQAPQNYLMVSGRIEGNSFSDLLVNMEGGNPPSLFGPFEWIYHWNGVKYSKENLELIQAVSRRFYRMNDDYFIVVFQDIFHTGISGIYRMTRKK
jgi:hypothetical protein